MSVEKTENLQIRSLIVDLIREIAIEAHKGAAEGEFLLNLNVITLQVIRHIIEITVAAQADAVTKSNEGMN